MLGLISLTISGWLREGGANYLSLSLSAVVSECMRSCVCAVAPELPVAVALLDARALSGTPSF